MSAWELHAAWEHSAVPRRRGRRPPERCNEEFRSPVAVHSLARLTQARSWNLCTLCARVCYSELELHSPKNKARPPCNLSFLPSGCTALHCEPTKASSTTAECRGSGEGCTVVQSGAERDYLYLSSSCSCKVFVARRPVNQLFSLSTSPLCPSSPSSPPSLFSRLSPPSPSPDSAIAHTYSLCL